MAEKLCELKKKSGGGASGGYQIVTGSTQTAPSASTKITLGFKPKVLILENMNGNTSARMSVYNEYVSTTTYATASSNSFSDADTFGTSIYKIESIDNDGFTIARQAYPIRYTAIG